MKPSKSKEYKLQAILEEGKKAAIEGKAMLPIPYESLEYRNAWLIGWRNGGGNIITGKAEQKQVSDE